MNILQKWWWHWKDPQVLYQSIATSIFVGTVLLVVTMGHRLLFQEISKIIALKMVLTYLVPYLVSSFTAVRTQVRLSPDQYAPETGTYRCNECLQSGRQHDVRLEADDNIPECEEYGQNTEYVLIHSEN